MKIERIHSLRGEVIIPGDKSISHRGVMFGAISQGVTQVRNFLQSADCLSTIQCFQNMGVEIKNTADDVIIHGKGIHGLSEPAKLLDAGNSGTTLRLLSGILAGQSFHTTLTGDESLQKRPMDRIMIPLTLMGADIRSVNGNNCAPLSIYGTKLHGMTYESPIASAQVKSCILLAGLCADSTTTVSEPYLSRNHTELMLKYFGADISVHKGSVSINPGAVLNGCTISVPGDISSAAYIIAASLIVPDSEVMIKNVGINPTRNGILSVCKRMGADITLYNIDESGVEPVADLLIRTSSLTGTMIEGGIIPTLIDEIPIIAVLAAYAQGTTVISNAEELKVKESNRLDIMVQGLSAMGVDIEGTEDGMIIRGGKPLHGAFIDSHLDHRIAMAFTVAGLAADGVTQIHGSECVTISYPGFFTDLDNLQKQ